MPETLGITGGRLIDKFPSDTTLWLILRKFESKEGQNLNFTARGVTKVENGATTGAGRIFYEMPSLNIMGRDLSDFGGLQKTLAQLGFNQGSVAIRLGFKATEQPLEEAMKEIGQYFKEEATQTSAEAPKEVETITDAIAKLPSHEPEGSQDVDMANAGEVATLSAPTTNDATPTPLTPAKRPAPESTGTSPAILGPDQRPIAVYAAPSGDTPKAALRPHNEDDFEPTIAHAKLHQSRLQESSINKRLPSDAEQEQAEKERAAKLAKKTSVNIKIRFPDQQSTISTFTASETGANLYEFVTGLILAEDQPFKLVYQNRGPQTVSRNEKKLIKDLGFEGAVVVHFLWEDAASDDARKGSVLKSQYVQVAKEIPVPEPAVEEAKEEGDSSTIDKGKGKENSSGGGSKGGKGGMPKWFKGLGKK